MTLEMGINFWPHVFKMVSQSFTNGFLGQKTETIDLFFISEDLAD